MQGPETVILAGGQQTLDYLLAQRGAAEPFEMVVLLDLTMPGMSGYQAFQRLKADERTRSILVVVLTTTDDPAEINPGALSDGAAHARGPSGRARA